MIPALCLIAWLSCAPVAAYLMGRGEPFDSDGRYVRFVALAVGPLIVMADGLTLAYDLGREHGKRHRRGGEP